MINLELNVTLQCNLACSNCNRFCHIYKNRTEHMSIEQVEKFIEQAKNNGGINRLKLLGGEPLLHPNFIEIYNILTKAAENNIIHSIKIETNKTIPIPSVPSYSFVSWGGRISKKKKHQPIMWSPEDLGINIKASPNCPQITKCGYSLDKYGYLPCSCAIMIARLFNKTELYRKEFPRELWGLAELCKHCIFAMPHEWRNQFSSRSILQHTEEEKTPTKSYKKAMEKFSQEEFYRNHTPF